MKSVNWTMMKSRAKVKGLGLTAQVVTLVREPATAARVPVKPDTVPAMAAGEVGRLGRLFRRPDILLVSSERSVVLIERSVTE